MRVLLTGGAGFMGSTVVRHLVARGDRVCVYDALTYAGSRRHVDGLDVAFLHADVCDPATLKPAVRGVDVVVHMAAESHVERSFRDVQRFVSTNVEGTRHVLEACTEHRVPLVHVSTDEVFGSAGPGEAFKENAPFQPGNPYAATKAAAECLVAAWRHTFGVSAKVVRCTNNYGERQHAEKAVSGWISRALRGQPLLVHGDGKAVRDWLHVDDFARGLLAVLDHRGSRQVFHLAGRAPRTNTEMARHIADLCGGCEVVSVADRAGQDARYALDDAPTREDLGWAPITSLDDGLTDLIARTRALG